MLFIKQPPFSNVVASGVATVNLIPGMSFNRIMLALGGTSFTKAMITDIKVRLNGKVIYQITGSQLDLVNTYRGMAVNAAYLMIDFSEPRMKRMEDQLLGNLNTAKGVSSLALEITIAGATAPTLTAYAEVGPPAALGVISKMIPFTFSIGGSGKYPLKIIDAANAGALLKRVHFIGTGSISSLEVKKNGITIFDDIPLAVNNHLLADYQLAPQANYFHYDPILDRNLANAVVTQDARSLEFNLTTSAAQTPTALVEVIDVLGNM